MSIEKDFLDAKAAYLRARRELFQEKMMSEMDKANLLVSQVLDIFDFAVTEYSEQKNPTIFMTAYANKLEFFVEDTLGTVDSPVIADKRKYSGSQDLKGLDVNLKLALERAERKKISDEELENFLRELSMYCNIDRVHTYYFMKLKY